MNKASVHNTGWSTYSVRPLTGQTVQSIQQSNKQRMEMWEVPSSGISLEPKPVQFSSGWPLPPNSGHWNVRIQGRRSQWDGGQTPPNIWTGGTLITNVRPPPNIWQVTAGFNSFEVSQFSSMRFTLTVQKCTKFSQSILRKINYNRCHQMSYFKTKNAPNSISKRIG